MALGTFTTLLYEVRRLLGDRKPGNPIVPTSLLEELTNVSLDELADEIGFGDLDHSSFITTVANISTYAITMTGSIPTLFRLKQLIRQFDKYVMRKCSKEDIQIQRIGGGLAFGPPRDWAPWEDSLGGLHIELYPTPVDVDTITATYEFTPIRVDDAFGTLYFSKTGLTALRQRVAGKAIEAVDEAALARMGKSRAYGQSLLASSAQIARAEWFRLHTGDHQDYVARGR